MLHLHVLRTALGSWAKSPPNSMETLLGTHARKMWCLEVTQLVESAASWEPSNHPSLPSASTTGRRTLTQGRLKLCSSVRLSFARACNPPFLDPVLVRSGSNCFTMFGARGWVPHMRPHMHDFRLWEFLISDLLCPTAPTSPLILEKATYEELLANYGD